MRTRKFIRNKERHYILIKGLVLLNVYVPNEKVSKYTKQKLIILKGEIAKATIPVGYFNNPLSEIIRSSQQKSVRIIITTNQLNLTDIHKIFHPTTDYTLFSIPQRLFTKTDHMLDNNMYLNKFKIITIIWSMLLTTHLTKGLLRREIYSTKCNLLDRKI